jgi:signal transduction histidine kinase
MNTPRATLFIKILLGALAPVFFFGILVMMFMRLEVTRVLREDHIASGTSVAINLASQTRHLFLTENYVNLSRLIGDAQKTDDDIIYVFVAGKNGHILSHTFMKAFPGELLHFNAAITGGQWHRETRKDPREGNIVDIAVPVLLGEAGMVHVGISERHVHEAVSRFFRAFLVALGTVFCIAAALSFLLAWVITTPARKLTEAAARISLGDFSRQITPTTNDEISDLVHSFNRMSSRLLEQKRIVEKQNIQLGKAREVAFAHEKMALVGQIAASVAHELNTPLATILLRSQLVRRQVTGTFDLSDLDVIEKEARRCRAITDTLLGFSRRSDDIREETDLVLLIRESISLMKNDLESKGILLEVNTPPEAIPVVVDRNKIQQIVINLITNAADALSGGGRLAITASRNAMDAVLDVKDDGIGIPVDILGRIFEPFFTTKERGKGTGLGLSICQQIVQEHGGTIIVESSVGKGTLVKVTFPLSRKEFLHA